MGFFKVSIIIPLYNREKFIVSCVNSVLKIPQAGEVILIDDGSSDGSYLICEKLARQDSRIKLLTHQNRMNKGVSASRNLGIKNAKFEFISFLDSDDVFLSNRFFKDEIIFKNIREANITYSLSEIQFETGKTIPFGTTFNTNNLVCKDDFYSIVLKRELILGHISSVTFRRSLFDTLKLWFDERLNLHEDTEFWYRLAKNHFFYPSELKKPVSVYFQHKSNTISTRSRISELKFLIVFIDNTGLKNLKKFEKDYISYRISRVFSNPIYLNFLRKSILHSIQWILKPFYFFFIPLFYHWGIWYFGFKVNR